MGLRPLAATLRAPMGLAPTLPELPQEISLSEIPPLTYNQLCAWPLSLLPPPGAALIHVTLRAIPEGPRGLWTASCHMEGRRSRPLT